MTTFKGKLLDSPNGKTILIDVPNGCVKEILDRMKIVNIDVYDPSIGRKNNGNLE